MLVVGFVLRGVRGPLHAAFRAESWLNIPLFVDAPGFTSKLWLADDATGRYRGIYEWDGAGRATSYIHYLSRILGLVSVPGSIRAHVIPNVHRDAALADPGSLTAAVPEPEPGPQEWWRPTAVRSAPSRSRWRRQ